MSYAGDTFNTAWYLRQLCPTWGARFVSRIGTDSASDGMLAMAQKAGLDTGHIGRSTDRSIGLYLISLVDGERSFSYWRDQSAARQLADDRDSLARAVADATCVYISGITLGILTPDSRQNLLSVVAEARAAGKVTMFDSNLRPRLWEDTATMCDTVMQAAAVSDIVLPSYDDEVTYFADADQEATRRRYLNAGATTVIVKNGDGVIEYAAGGNLGQVTPNPVGNIVDTTAAGDSFNAGFVAGFLANAPIEDAIMQGAGVAAQVISQRGALVNLDLTKL